MLDPSRFSGFYLNGGKISKAAIRTALNYLNNRMAIIVVLPNYPIKITAIKFTFTNIADEINCGDRCLLSVKLNFDVV
jgi:hypothetical protein